MDFVKVPSRFLARWISGRASLIRAVERADWLFRIELYVVAISCLVTFVGMVHGWPTALYERVAFIAAPLVAFLSIILVLRKYRDLVLESRHTRWATRLSKAITYHDTEISFDKIRPSESEAALGFSAFLDPKLSNEAFIRSAAFDNALVLAPKIPFTFVRSRKWKFFSSNSAVRQNQLKFLVTRVRRAGMPTKNEMKCGLLMDEAAPPESVQLYKVGYFDSLMTNEAFRSHMFETESPRWEKIRGSEVDLTADFPLYRNVESRDSNTALIKRLNETATGNHIGVTTVVVTADRHLMVLRQGNTAVNAGTLLLGGSGSSDWSDREMAVDSSDLRSFLAVGMAREFIEEAAAAKPYRQRLKIFSREKRVRHAAEETLVTGYFRWVNRCGKPEFIGVTRTPLLRAELQGDDDEVRRFETNIPVLSRLSDFAAIRDELIEFMRKWNDEKDRKSTLRLGLSSHVALLRLAEISTYKDSTDATEKAIYHRVAEHLGVDE